jgi:hypothetical protein
LYGAPLPPFPGRDLRALIGDRQVDVVLLRRGYPGPWREILTTELGAPRQTGGMLVWRVRGTWPRSLGSVQ